MLMEIKFRSSEKAIKFGEISKYQIFVAYSENPNFKATTFCLIFKVFTMWQKYLNQN